jgi:4-hydroxybenzoate polyprenyltransferase
LIDNDLKTRIEYRIKEHHKLYELPVIAEYWEEIFAKSIEDIEGYRAKEYETFPIEFVIPKAILLSAIYLLLIAGETLYLMIKDGNIWFNLYAAVFILAPVVFISLKLKNASEKKHFTIIQRLLKLLMVTGMISVLLL